MYRAFRAQENMKEWAVITIPLLWLFSTFVKRVPVVGEYEWILTLLAGHVYAWFNRKYYEGYVESAEGRVEPFKMRTNVVKFLLFGTCASMAYIVAENTFLK